VGPAEWCVGVSESAPEIPREMRWVKCGDPGFGRKSTKPDLPLK